MATHAAAKKPACSDWHKADVKAALEKHGWTLRSLAKHHDISHAAIASALRRRYPASEQRIAAAIGVHPAAIWPSRYAPARVIASPGAKHSTQQPCAHVKNSGQR